MSSASFLDLVAPRRRLAPAEAAQVGTDHPAFLGQRRDHLAPDPPVLRPAVQQHDGRPLPRFGDVLHVQARRAARGVARPRRAAAQASWTSRWPRWASTTSSRPRAASWSKVIGRRSPVTGARGRSPARAQLPVERRQAPACRAPPGLERRLARELRARLRRRARRASGVRRSSSRLSSQLRRAASRARSRIAPLRARAGAHARSPSLLGRVVVERAPAAEHRLLDLGGDHRAGAAEVLADLLDLATTRREEVEVAFERPGPLASTSALLASRRCTKWWTSTSSARWPWRSMRPLRCSSRFGFHGISEWTSRWQWFCRSMPSLRRVGGEQDPDRATRPGRPGTRLLIRSRSSRRPCRREQRDAVAGEPAGGEQLVQPALGVAVLGEDDHAARRSSRRRAGTSARASRAAPSALRVGRCRGALGPGAQLGRAAPRSSALERLGSGAALEASRVVLGLLVLVLGRRAPRRPRRTDAAGPSAVGARRARRRGAFAAMSRCTSSVRANAAGDENSRFFSS